MKEKSKLKIHERKCFFLKERFRFRRVYTDNKRINIKFKIIRFFFCFFNFKTKTKQEKRKKL